MSDDADEDGSILDRRPGGMGGGEQVVRLAEFDAVSPARITSDLRDYWESLRKGRAVPDRADVEPRGIRRALDYAFILERIAPGAARFRLAGRHLVDLMGMEVRGMPVCSFVGPASRGRLSDLLESVFKAPQIAELWLEAPAEYSRPALSGRMLLLPLKSDLGDITRALGCLVAEGDIGVTPRRFNIAQDRVMPIIRGAKVMEPSPSGFRDEPELWRAPLLSKPQVPLAENASPEDRRARFRIVSDNS